MKPKLSNCSFKKRAADIAMPWLLTSARPPRPAKLRFSPPTPSNAAPAGQITNTL